MEFSRKAVVTMAEIMMTEMKQVGMESGDIRTIETGMRELLRSVGAKALGQYLEEQEEEHQREAVECQCGRRWRMYAKENRPKGQSAAQFVRQRLDALQLGQELTGIAWGAKRLIPPPLSTNK